MIYFLIGFILGGFSGIILTGIIDGRKVDRDEQ